MWNLLPISALTRLVPAGTSRVRGADNTLVARPLTPTLSPDGGEGVFGALRNRCLVGVWPAR